MATEAQKQNARDGGYEVLLTGFGTYDAYTVSRNGEKLPGQYGLESDAWDAAVAARWRDQHER